MAKDDLVLGLGRPMYGTSVHANRKKAYPSVITTLAQVSIHEATARFHPRSLTLIQTTLCVCVGACRWSPKPASG